MNNFKCGYVGIIGPTNAGKSTLLNAVLGRKTVIVSPKPHTTRDRILGIKNSVNSQIVFLDTPGFIQYRGKSFSPLEQRLNRLTKDVAREVDVVVLVIDASKYEDSFEQLEKLYISVKEKVDGAPSIIVFNKIDLIQKRSLLPLIDFTSKFYIHHNPIIIPVCSKDRTGINDLLEEIENILPDNDKVYPDDYFEEQSDEFFISEIIREKLLLKLRAELPYEASVHISQIVDSDTLIKIDANIVVPRDSQKSIVIGKGGEMIKEIGTLAREELEKLYETKVMLNLFVKVRDLERSGQ